MEKNVNNNFLFIDNVSYNLEGINYTNLNLLDFITKQNIILPRFCYHSKLSIAGNCRMCLIEVSDSIKPVVSCAMSLRNNIKIFTNSALIKRARESVLEFLLVNHPLDCPICDQGGECDLQDQTLLFGNDRGRFYENKKVTLDKDCSPFIKTIMTRCIHCTRCIRFLNDLCSSYELGMLGRGFNMEIGTYTNNKISSELVGNIIDLCPVGALTSKSYSYKSRPWELYKYNSFDNLDTFGSNIIIFIKNYKIYRILPNSNNEFLNEQWISDRTRFYFDSFYYQRLSFPYKFNKHIKKFEIISWKEVYNILKYIKEYTNINNINIILQESTISINELIELKKIKNHINLYNFDYNLLNLYKDFRFHFLEKDKKSELQKNKVFIFLGTSLRFENPILNLQFLKDSKKKNNKNNIYLSIGSNFNNNFDLKNIANNSKYFFDFLKGKNILNIFIQNLKLNNYEFNYIIGFSFIKKIKTINNLIFSIKSYLYIFIKNLKIIFLVNNPLLLNCLELNINLRQFNNNIDINKKTISIFLENRLESNINYNLIKNLMYKSFFNILYVTHGFNFINKLKFDLLLPSSLFLEKKNYSYNLYGSLQKSLKININYKDSKNLENFLLFLKYILKFKNNKNELNLLFKNEIIIKNNYLFEISSKNINKIIIKNINYISFHNNPYIINNITNFSLNLTKSLKDLKYYYNKNFNKKFLNF